MRPKRIKTLSMALSLTLYAGIAHAAPVLMISIDGLRPGDVLEASQRGNSLPTLTTMLKNGAYTQEAFAWRDRHA